MTIIPPEVLARWTANATRRGKSSVRRNRSELKDLLELRDTIDEIKSKGERTIMTVYEEADEAMNKDAETIRHLIANLRQYPEADLYNWIDGGLSFAAIAKINSIGDLLNDTPANVLTKATALGDEKGRPMTAAKIEAFALGHRPGVAMQWKLNQFVDKLTSFVGLPEDRITEFRKELFAVFVRFGLS
mgnify:FL=1